MLQGRPLTLMGSGARSRRSFAALHMVHYSCLRGVVGQTFNLADTAKAHETMAGRDFFGKLVFRVLQPPAAAGWQPLPPRSFVAFAAPA